MQLFLTFYRELVCKVLYSVAFTVRSCVAISLVMAIHNRASFKQEVT